MKYLWPVAAAAVLAVAAMFLTRHAAESGDAPVAVGLRGTTTVTRPMTTTQVERLERHLLAVPPRPIPAAPAASPAQDTLDRVRHIQSFNRAQGDQR